MNLLNKPYGKSKNRLNGSLKITGQALLTIGMISPSGNPAGDIQVKKLKATSYNVSYTAAEKGDHTMVIRWGTDDVPGSPFTIPVA